MMRRHLPSTFYGGADINKMDFDYSEIKIPTALRRLLTICSTWAWGGGQRIGKGETGLKQSTAAQLLVFLAKGLADLSHCEAR